MILCRLVTAFIVTMIFTDANELFDDPTIHYEHLHVDVANRIRMQCEINSSALLINGKVCRLVATRKSSRIFFFSFDRPGFVGSFRGHRSPFLRQISNIPRPKISSRTEISLWNLQRFFFERNLGLFVDHRRRSVVRRRNLFLSSRQPSRQSLSIKHHR